MLLPEQNPEQRPYDLLQQRHPLRVYVPAAADYAVHVGAAGHTCATGVGAVPHRACLDFVYQCLCFPSNDMLRDGDSCISGTTCSPTLIVGMYHLGALWVPCTGNPSKRHILQDPRIAPGQTCSDSIRQIYPPNGLAVHRE